MEQVNEYRTFDAKTGITAKSRNLKLNCHVCGKTFSPLQALLTPLDKCDYYLGTYCRLYTYQLSIESYKLVCKHIVPVGYTWLYDPKDDMQGKEVSIDELIDLSKKLNNELKEDKNG